MTASLPYRDDIAELFAAAGALLKEHFAGLAEKPVTRFQPPATLEKKHDRRLGEKPQEMSRVWAHLTQILRDGNLLHHPGYMGHQVAAPFPLAAAAAGIAQAVNQGMAVWEMSPAATIIERRVLRWMSDAVSLGPEAAGAFVSGGTMANLCGILAARNRAGDGSIWQRGTDRADRLCVLVSDQTHYSIARSCGVLGLGSDAVVQVATDDRFRMTAEAVEEALTVCRTNGRRPIALVATAGTTSTGSFDPLDELAPIAQREGLWFHVDGAHGASFSLSAKHRSLLRGIERADSLAWDPHKMLFMPMSTSMVLFARATQMDELFRGDAPYLFGTSADVPADLNIGERTFQCSRAWDALKVWLSFERYGAAAFAEMMEHTVTVARHLHAAVLEADDFEPLHEPECNIVCFRYRWNGATENQLNRLNYDLRNRLNRGGHAWITTSVLRGKRALRATIINPLTEPEHVERLLAELRVLARALRAEL